MRLAPAIVSCLSFSGLVSAFAIRSKRYHVAESLQQREDHNEEYDEASPMLAVRFDEELLSYLEKRRGGGGSGGGGGRSSGSSSSGSSSSGSSSSGSSSGGSSRSGSSGSGSTAGSRNTGTASSSSQVRPSYGGGRYYGGGAATPYRAGGRSPLGGILPFALVGGAIGAAAIFPGLWLYGAYEYNYNNRYNFRNRTNDTANGNTTLPVTCLCQQYSACGCDDNGNNTFLDGLVGNGSYQGLNKSLVTVQNVNGTRTLVLNGTLPNGTDSSASSSATPTSAAASIDRTAVEGSGYCIVGGIVWSMLWFM